jgi:uncharacterized protein (UPF0335 family)
MSRIDEATTVRLNHLVYIAKAIDLVFAAIYKMSMKGEGYDAKVVQDIIHGIFTSEIVNFVQLNR